MSGLAAWAITDGTPRKLQGTTVELEKELENWIEADPGLVDRGLVVLQQQLSLGAAGRLDLLCVDQQGRIVIVEIKRASLNRDTIAQGIDYASMISGWDGEIIRRQVSAELAATHKDHPGVNALLRMADAGEQPEIEIIIVGTGADSSVERMINFLGSGHTVPIRAVTFEVFGLDDGRRILVREDREPEIQLAQPKPQSSLDTVLVNVGGSDTTAGQAILEIVTAAERNGLYPRPYTYSVMLTPPEKRTRALATAWKRGIGDVLLQYWPETFAEFFSVTPEQLSSILGTEKIELASVDDAVAWGKRLDALFAQIAANEGDGDGNGS